MIASLKKRMTRSLTGQGVTEMSRMLDWDAKGFSLGGFDQTCRNLLEMERCIAS